MIYVFDKFNTIPESEYSRLYNLLPPSRKQKADLRFGLDKKICILEYFILKRLLNFSGYPDFTYGENGKPMLNGYHFSISHADDILCMAVEDVECGIDIEKTAEFDQKIANYLLNEGELKTLETSKNKGETLTKFFTQKEATTKCLGIRLDCDLKYINDPHAFNYTYKKHKDYLICECTHSKQ